MRKSQGTRKQRNIKPRAWQNALKVVNQKPFPCYLEEQKKGCESNPKKQLTTSFRI